MNVDIDEFIAYLIEQIGQPYIWGGQHTKLTPQNYVSVITRKESDETNRRNAIEYCKRKFDAGATVLYGYDCSGLGMYWLQNVNRIYSHDMSANRMLKTCTITNTPKRGYWVFRMSGEKASHIGYMISDTEVIHAKGRAYGVVKAPFLAAFWHVIAIPSCMNFDEPAPRPEPTHRYVHVLGGSVRVRSGNGTKYPSIGTVHRGDLLPCFGTDDRDPYWYMVKYKGQDAYITSNERYTELIWKL